MYRVFIAYTFKSNYHLFFYCCLLCSVQCSICSIKECKHIYIYFFKTAQILKDILNSGNLQKVGNNIYKYKWFCVTMFPCYSDNRLPEQTNEEAAKGCRAATMNIQGRAFNVRAPIIRFQYPALMCARAWACTCFPIIVSEPVRLSAQTHTGEEQERLADRHHPIHNSAAVRREKRNPNSPVFSSCNRQSAERPSPVPVGSVVVEASLVEAALGQGLLLVQDELLQPHLHLGARHGACGEKMRKKVRSIYACIFLKRRFVLLREEESCYLLAVGTV